jgi:gluconolactonase
MRTLEFDVMAEGLVFPEGPLAFPDGSVVFVEIGSGRIMRAWGEGRVEVVSEVGGGPNGLAIGPDGAFYVCNNGGMQPNRASRTDPDAIGRIERVDPTTGKVDRLYDHVDERPLSAPNDLVFDRDGGLWFTDIGKVLTDRTEFSGLFYAQPDGSCVTQHHWGAFSYNGVGLSPDERTLYVADTRNARLWAFGLDGPGEMAPPPQQSRSRRRLVGAAPGNVSLDSLAVTASGNVCVGTLGHAGAPGGISVFNPDGDVERYALPDTVVTNICFGGPDMCTAYVTWANTGRLSALSKVVSPRPSAAHLNER